MLSKHFQPKHLQIAALLALLHGTVVCSATSAQDGDDRALPRLVSKEEGEALAQTALQHWPQIRDKPDCSHLVHDVYAEAGLDYEYATTDEIFDGVKSFQRVRNPQPGDLVVWQGHVGIVIDPEDTSFYSSVISGFSVSSFSSSYWMNRGPRRFYRYKINAAQSARLLSRMTLPKLHSPASVAAPFSEDRFADSDALESDAPDVKPATPERGPSARVLTEKRIPGPTISSTRPPEREEIRSAFTQFSEIKAAELQQSSSLGGPVEVVDSFEIAKIETQGSFGWVELKIKKVGVLTDGGLSSIHGTEKVRFSLLRQADGWTLQGPANSVYLLRQAAVRMIAGRLAALARNPDNQKELKPLTKALAALLADDRS
jgi:hypothetical protein